ncbi:hypothetical protein [Roseovarius sp. 2305UL8-3]|uniref:hypothetical protein n=1 Tax=Roseovarius conchicola TaxID=3121636 RepID=UPI003527C8EF
MRRISALLLTAFWVSAADAQQPLSAIDWLDKQNSVPLAQPRLAPSEEPPVTTTADIPGVKVTPLGEAQPDSVGLLPTTTTGLPRSMWRASAARDVIAHLARADPDSLPAVQALIYTLLLAEADAPTALNGNAEFLKARVHTLVRFGAVDPARALLERAGPTRKGLFDLWLNLSLLTGDEDKACNLLRDEPGLSPDYAARIFCTARAGDWSTAALTYDTAVAIGTLDGQVATLLAEFLDPEMIDNGPQLAPPSEPTPLVFRLYEANGAPLPTIRLPRAFAMADLRGTSGWRSELEAAERLARTGALPATRLLGLYTDRSPAASGGIWDRVRAFQSFDKALFSRDPQKVADALPEAWTTAKERGLAVPFAQLFADGLMELDMPEDTKPLVYRIALLSPDYEIAPTRYPPKSGFETLLAGLARGEPDGTLATTPLETAIVDGFSSTAASDPHAPLLEEGKLGEAILLAAIQLGEGRVGRERDVREGIATLRAVGLEDTARRAALQLLILVQR